MSHTMATDARDARSPNAEWQRRSLRHVWHPCTQMKVHETLPLMESKYTCSRVDPSRLMSKCHLSMGVP